MKAVVNPIINTNELIAVNADNNLRILDARSGPNAKKAFEQNHLKNAQYVDLENDLADTSKDPENGGRHPLPRPIIFANTVSQLGINSDSHIVIYDDAKGANAAARLWWMLLATGHKNVQVLNGGLQEAIKHNYPTETGPAIFYKPTEVSFTSYNLPVTLMATIQHLTQTNNALLIDVRSTERFQGKHEPIDLIAGHIPTAINIPFTENLAENGLFLSPKELREKYAPFLANNKTETNAIFHCGSGVTACHSLLAVAYAGFEIPSLYVGSWSEWSRNENSMVY